MNTAVLLEKTPTFEMSPHMARPDGYERLSAALFGRPDRPPIVVQPGLYAMALHGLSGRRFFSEPETFVRTSQNMAAYFGFDWWSPVFDVFNIEAEALGQALVWCADMEPWADRDHPLLRERSDLDWLTPPIPGKSGRMPFVIEVYRRFTEMTGVAPVCVCCSPFTLAALVRGLRPLIVDMYREPSFVDRLLVFLREEVVVPWVRCLAEATGASAVVMCDPFAGPPTLSPSLERRFRRHHVEAVIQATNSPSCAVLDGRGGCQGQVADASLVMDVKLLELPTDQLRDGSPAEIVGAVCQVLEESQGGGRFALLMHNIPIGMPVENVLTAVAAAKQFGQYPIAERLARGDFQKPKMVRFQQWVRQHGLPV